MPTHSRLARLLRAILALQLAATLAWLAWRWPASVPQALAGAALIVLIAPIVLGIEFMLLAAVARSDPTARASARSLFLAWVGECRELFRVFYCRLPFRWRVPADDLGAHCAGRTGVVLIHGFVCNRGLWAPWLRQLRDRGRAHVAVNLEPVFGSIDDYVAIIDEAVRSVTQATGKPPVLICHSMGGLVARTWLRAGAGDAKVAHVITIGSPHQGTWLGRFSRTPNGRQMRLRSGWLDALGQDESRRTLAAFTCWYSNCDNIVFPPSTATLAHADNRFVEGVAHVAMVFDPRVVAPSLALVESMDRPMSK